MALPPRRRNGLARARPERVDGGAPNTIGSHANEIGGWPMRASTERIVTSHVGSLPRPEALIAANLARAGGGDGDGREAAYQEELRAAVGDVVARQREVGIDVPNDGEFGKAVTHRVHYGAWWSYAFERWSGIEFGAPGAYGRQPRRSQPGEIVLTSQDDRRDRQLFAGAYGDPESGVSTGPRPVTGPVCVAPLRYTGQAALQADIANLKAALAAAGSAEGFMTAVAPGSAYRIGNAYYPSDEEFLAACAEAMREEYKAIVDAGLILQLDDPATATGWDMISPEPDLADYKKFTMVRIEALNHALRGLPKERIRYHLCWGSWHGPHVTDIALRDIVDVMLAVEAGGYSFEAGNVRHAHEWQVWQEVKLPDDRLILPGIVSHATNVVEHPELVADRICRFADIVGRERVIAATDCGLGGRVHPQIAWAKLKALADGAELASRRLWG
jgi:5-methyltetrahydropteroyltriglutamate--homocysteine methyltransferase